MSDLAWKAIASISTTVLVVGGIVVVGLWLYNRREARRKRALRFANIMREWYLEWFAEGFDMYAVGDYSGLAYKVREIVETVNSGEVMLLKLDRCFWNILKFYCGKPDKLAEIQKVIAASKPTPAAPAAATATAPAAAKLA